MPTCLGLLHRPASRATRAGHRRGRGDTQEGGRHTSPRNRHGVTPGRVLGSRAHEARPGRCAPHHLRQRALVRDHHRPSIEGRETLEGREALTPEVCRTPPLSADQGGELSPFGSGAREASCRKFEDFHRVWTGRIAHDERCGEDGTTLHPTSRVGWVQASQSWSHGRACDLRSRATSEVAIRKLFAALALLGVGFVLGAHWRNESESQATMVQLERRANPWWLDFATPRVPAKCARSHPGPAFCWHLFKT
jgi:hypothetical protein